MKKAKQFEVDSQLQLYTMIFIETYINYNGYSPVKLANSIKKYMPYMLLIVSDEFKGLDVLDFDVIGTSTIFVRYLIGGHLYSYTYNSIDVIKFVVSEYDNTIVVHDPNE